MGFGEIRRDLPSRRLATVSAVTDPRYWPAKFSHDQQSFGRAQVIAWKEADPNDPGSSAKLEASKFQHEVALQIRDRARAKFGGVAQYAEHIGQGENRLGKVLRGAQPMQLDDITAAVLYLDLPWPLTTTDLSRRAARTRWAPAPGSPRRPPT